MVILLSGNALVLISQGWVSASAKMFFCCGKKFFCQVSGKNGKNWQKLQSSRVHRNVGFCLIIVHQQLTLVTVVQCSRKITSRISSLQGTVKLRTIHVQHQCAVINHKFLEYFTEPRPRLISAVCQAQLLV